MLKALVQPFQSFGETSMDIFFLTWFLSLSQIWSSLFIWFFFNFKMLWECKLSSLFICHISDSFKCISILCTWRKCPAFKDWVFAYFMCHHGLTGSLSPTSIPLGHSSQLLHWCIDLQQKHSHPSRPILCSSTDWLETTMVNQYHFLTRAYGGGDCLVPIANIYFFLQYCFLNIFFLHISGLVLSDAIESLLVTAYYNPFLETVCKSPFSFLGRFWKRLTRRNKEKGKISQGIYLI